MEPTKEGIFSETAVYCTAMYLAAQNGHHDVVKYISELKIKPDKEEAFRTTSLYLAAYNGCSDMYHLFSPDFKQPAHSDGFNLYEETLQRLERNINERNASAKIRKDDKAINMLLKCGIDSVDENGNTALHLAAKDGNIHLLERLLKLNASVEIKNKNYESPLHLAAGSGNVEVIRKLLQFVFVDVRNFLNNTPLYYAIEKGDLNVIEMLLEQGACINIVNNDGDAPIHYVDNEDVLNLLIDKGADIALIKKNGNSLLHNAAEKNFNFMIDVYIQWNIEIDGLNYAKKTALHLAAQAGYKNIVCKLLQHNADMHCKTNSGALALHLATTKGHLRIVDVFLERGIDVDKKINHKSCLILAVENGHVNVVKILLSKGAKVNFDDIYNLGLTCAFIEEYLEIFDMCVDKVDRNWKNSKGRTLLSLVTEKGYVKLVKILFSKGFDFNTADCNKRSPIDYAIISGSVEMVELFLNYFDVNKLLYNNSTILNLAVEENNVSLVRMLLKKDMNIVDNNIIHHAINNGRNEIVKLFLNYFHINKVWYANSTILNLASAKNKVSLVKMLLTMGADVNIADTNNCLPIHHALRNNFVEVAELCLEKMNNINHADSYGDTPLRLAIQNNCTTIIKKILNKGVDINLDNINNTFNNRRTLLSVAAEKGCVNIVKLLLTKGADVNIVDRSNFYSPIHYAFQNKHFDIVELCLENQIDINLLDSESKSYLYLAAQNEHELLVKKLLAKGASVTNGNDYLYTPLYVASNCGNLKIVKLLLKHEEDNNISSYNKGDIFGYLRYIKNINIKLLLQEYFK